MMIWVALLWIFLVAPTVVISELSEYTEYLRQKFDRKFNHTCSKYPFVTEYMKILGDPTIETYVAFIFEEPGQQSGAGGGLGDRLGGMLTALAYAIRTRRKLVIQADTSFSNLFRPFPTTELNRYEPYVSWGNWSWLGWEHQFSKNMSALSCVNPNKRATHCALDSEKAYSSYKVIRYAGNRCYMCRWLKLAGEDVQKEHLKSTISVDFSANLYEIAGCMLRLVLYPTDLMWQKVDNFMQDINESKKNLTRFHNLQIGVHFRCGDASFDETAKKLPNSQCYWSPSIPWEGTNFGDDQSMDSPMDLAKCLNQSVANLRRLLPRRNHHRRLATHRNLHNNVTDNLLDATPEAVVFVASDNIFSAKQIANNIGGNLVLLPRESCHIDIKAGGKANCAENTLVQWFTLTLSDFLITQEMELQYETLYSDPVYDQDEFRSRSPAPISAFSRYAVTYGLSSRLLRYGNCSTIDPISLSHYTHGNWICLPKMFY